MIFVIEDKIIRVLGVINDISLKIIHIFVEKIGVKMNNFRVGLLQL